MEETYDYEYEFGMREEPDTADELMLKLHNAKEII